MTLAIPASQIVAVNPGVVGAGGSALDLNGLMLTTSTRVPVGTVLSFPTQLSVAAFFGANSTEAALALIYFNGFDNSAVKPGALLFAQYPWAAPVAPYVRGGNIAAALSLAQLQALAPGTLTVVLNGLSHVSGTINLSGATSFSNAASLIQTALGANDATFTGSIAASTATVTGSIAGNVLAVGGILSGTGVTAGTQIQAQLGGTTGGIGTYQVSASQTVSSTTISETYGTLTVSAISAGAVALGQVLAGAGITANTSVTALGTGTGGTGTYIVSPTQTVGSEAMTSGAALVTFDSVSGAFIITGGTPGLVGTIAFPSGAMATSLLLTQATGAVLSQGAALATPAAFMNAIVAQTQNWATFFTTFDPVAADKVAFATWVNGQQTQYLYSEWAQDVANTLPNPNTGTSQIIAGGFSGTAPIYGPLQGASNAALLAGFVASIDFQQTNGRTTMAFQSQSGFSPEVTNATIASQLIANGLNFYGSYSTANDNFNFVYPGSVTGPFKWLDSYVNAIWLKNQLQLALMTLLTSVPSIPYNSAGYDLIEAACADPINAAVNFGAIRAGVPLSALQVAEVNNAAGAQISDVLQNRGWYLQVLPATAQVRVARQSPPITLWYMDGQSVQQITLQSLEVQ